ncbi:uncharacterized protein LOC110942286 isoform X2 [Helianthus annuus]|uniref:Uncharacterized protein n=1 Tax=Helianthus annuus TaxID=4232 RepID=A0A251UVD1_HELAN|nr:uncharacterized protein LOC110942286 isoform X2 [Helianthus annuus]
MDPSHQLFAHLQFQFHILRSVQDSRFTLPRPESPFIRNQRTMEGTTNQPKPTHPETAPAVKHNKKRKTPSVTKPSLSEYDPQADSPAKHVKPTPSATSMNNPTQLTNKKQGAIATTSEPENKRIDQEKNNDDWEDDEWWSTNIHDIIAACTPHDTN